MWRLLAENARTRVWSGNAQASRMKFPDCAKTAQSGSPGKEPKHASASFPPFRLLAIDQQQPLTAKSLCGFRTNTGALLLISASATLTAAITNASIAGPEMRALNTLSYLLSTTCV